MTFARFLPRIQDLAQDFRFALQWFYRRPGFTLISVLSLGLGIGLNAMVFTWIEAVYLNPLPGVDDARELVTVNAAYRDANGMANSYADWAYIGEHNRVFSGLLAHETLSLAFSDGGSVEVVESGIVSGNYFTVLGVEAAMGRTFRPDEDEVVDRNPVVVISYAFWQRRFGANPDVVGRRVELNRVPFTIIGVSARDFAGIYGGIRQDLWTPLAMTRALDARHRDQTAKGSWLQLMGRPKPGVELSHIQADLDVLSAQIRSSYRKTQPDYRAEAFALHHAQRGYLSSFFEMVRILAVVVAIILLLACLNVANLLIAKAAGRSREISIRMSLGATRARILQQLLIESAVLAGISAALGLVIVWWSPAVAALLLGNNSQMVLNAGTRWELIAFLFAVSLVAAMIFGLLPALETLRVNPVETLKESSGSLTGGRRRVLWRKSLAVSQVALSIVSLAGASLLSQYLRRIAHTERGFRTENVLTAQADLFAAGIEGVRGRRFYRTLTEELQGTRGILSAAWTSFLPMSGSGGGNRRGLVVPGFVSGGGEAMSVVVDSISSGYLRTLGIPLIEGREFAWTDDDSSQRVAMVNERFAQLYFRGRNPIGAAVQIGKDWCTIVGIHRNYVYRHPDAPVRPAVFLPLSQDYASSAILVVRTASHPAAITGVVRQRIRAFEATIPVSRVMTLEENIADQFVETRIATDTLKFLSGLAALLAGMGLYGVLASFVSQRRREFGIRAAVGASPQDLQRMVVFQGVRLALTGMGLGLLLSAAFARLLHASFSGLDPMDPLPYLVSAISACAVAVLSAWRPSRQAAHVDPSVALRQE